MDNKETLDKYRSELAAQFVKRFQKLIKKHAKTLDQWGAAKYAICSLHISIIANDMKNEDELSTYLNAVNRDARKAFEKLKNEGKK